MRGAVDRHGGDDSPSSEAQAWERDLALVRKVAAWFPTMETEELEAELAATLLALKRRNPSGIHDWNAYLAQCLFNRASTLARKWRARLRRESSSELLPERSEPTPSEEPDSPAQEWQHSFSRIHALDAKSRAFLEILKDCGGNQSLAARRLGVHRNTIRRRLQKIRRALIECPIENVTGGLRLTVQQRQELTQITEVGNSKARDILKARLILALASGQTYAQIVNQLHTTRPTISRWRHRFVEHGIEGLKARHHGGKPRSDARKRVSTWFLRTRQATGGKAQQSCRRIAQALGLAKSTVYRILRTLRRPHGF
jgi:transposase